MMAASTVLASGSLATKVTARKNTPKMGARIELAPRWLTDGTLVVDGAWVRRGKRQPGVSRYLGHIPADQLKTILNGRLTRYEQRKKEEHQTEATPAD